MSREEVLAGRPQTDTQPAWWVKRTQPTKGDLCPEVVEIRAVCEFDLSDPNDRAQLGVLAEALRYALNSSVNSWAGGA